jgi:hypothetical protein
MKNVILCRFLLLLSLLLSQELTVSAATRRALVFGIGKQEDTSWGRIHGDNDVVYVRRMLIQMGYTNIRTLTNEQATKAAMVKAFQDLANDCQRGDIVYVHYSGHGQLMTDLDGDEELKHERGSHRQWDEAWIPYDAYMTYCAKDRGEKHLSDDEVALLLQDIRKKIGSQGELTVVVDACHSGDATCGPEEEEAVRGVDTRFAIPRTPDTPQPQLVKEQWRTISACKPYQLCTELKDREVGKLTYALYTLGAEAFKSGNKNLEEMLEQFMQRHQGRIPQTPVVSGREKSKN